jgi:1-deoxy-D-xylulose-5-phosphate synthase
MLDDGLKVRTMVLPDCFIDQDKPEAMYAKAGLNPPGIVRTVMAALGRAHSQDKAAAGAPLLVAAASRA